MKVPKDIRDRILALCGESSRAPRRGLVRRARASEDVRLVLVRAWCRERGVPEPEPEFLFALGVGRRWRFDAAWPRLSPRPLALEFEGLTSAGGRHQRVAGYTADVIKYNEAALLGWTVIRATTRQVVNGEVYGWLERAFKDSQTP